MSIVQVVLTVDIRTDLSLSLFVFTSQYYDVKPAAVVGHSVGEVAAAFLSGILSLADRRVGHLSSQSPATFAVRSWAHAGCQH